MKERMISKCFRDRKLVVALSLVMILLMACQIFTEHYRGTLEAQRLETYGYHNGAAFDIAEGSATALKAHRAVTASGTMTIFGQVQSEVGQPVGAIGQVDTDFQAFQDLQFLEGSYPVAADEIAVENVLLDQLRLPYTVGQSITLQIVPGDGQAVSRTYTLTGILRTYSTNWISDGYSLCTAFVGSSSDPILERHLFFLADYSGWDQMMELDPLVFGTEKSTLVYNSYSYPTAQWSVTRMIEDGMLSWIAALISVLFLSAVYISGYRKYLHRIRILLSLGIDRLQLYWLLYRQTLRIWAVTFCAVSIGCSVIVLAVPGYRISVFPYLLSGVLSLLIVMTAKTVQVVLLNRISILPKGRDLTKLAASTLPRRDKEITSLEDFCKVQRSRNRKYFALEKCVAFLAVIAVFFCMYGICKTQQQYNRNQQIMGYDYRWTDVDPLGGLLPGHIVQLKNTAHIKQVVYTSRADYDCSDGGRIRLDYDTNDPYCEIHNRREVLDGLGVSLLAIPEDSPLWDYYILPNAGNVDAFRQGEAVLIYLPDYQQTDNGSYTSVNNFTINPASDSLPVIRPGIEAGDTITITARKNRITLTCDNLIRRFPSTAQTMMDFLTPGTVLVSEELYSRLLDRSEIRYNEVFAVGDSNLSYEIGDKLMSGIAAGTSVSFENNRVQTEMNRQKFMTDAAILTIGAVLSCILTLLILQHNRTYLYAAEQERNMLLTRMGCPQEAIQRMLAPRLGRWLVSFGVILNLILVLAIGWQEFHFFVPEGTITARWTRIILLAFYDFNWIILFMPQIIVLILIGYTLHRERYHLLK